MHVYLAKDKSKTSKKETKEKEEVSYFPNFGKTSFQLQLQKFGFINLKFNKINLNIDKNEKDYIVC